MIEVQRLAAFREVARAGSFAGAAQALHHTPSAISQQIAALERSAGVALVERTTRGVTLTDAGRLLLASADAVHAELQTASRQLRELQIGSPPTLTVATFPSAGEPLLAPALIESAGVGSPVEVTVIEAEPDEALAHLRNGEADLALVYHFHRRKPPDHWAKTAGAARYIPLLVDPLRLLVPATHRLAGRKNAAFDALTEERWVQGWGDTGGALDTFAVASGFTPRVACRSSDYRFMSALVGAGVGIALVPQLAVPHQPDLHDLALVPSPIRYVGVYQARRRPHYAAGQLVSALRGRAAGLAAGH
jgi:DNA-binding transcriptional LysR family regulator